MGRESWGPNSSRNRGPPDIPRINQSGPTGRSQSAQPGCLGLIFVGLESNAVRFDAPELPILG